MNNDILVSEWIKLHWGIAIPDFNLLGGAGYGAPNVFAHLILYLLVAFLATESVFRLYDLIFKHHGVASSKEETKK